MDIIVKWRQLSEPNDQVLSPPIPQTVHGQATLISGHFAWIVAAALLHDYHLRLFVVVLQVLWVDLLTKKEFEAGFGSHTPMFSGQSKCVRYYMNFERAVRLLKTIIAKVYSPPLQLI